MSGSGKTPERVLLLSYAFPPIALPEAYLAAKTMGNIPGVDVDVVSSVVRGQLRLENSIYTWRDPSLDEYVRSRFQRVVRVPEPKLAQALPLHRIPVFGQAPDPHVYSTFRAVEAAESLDLSRYAATVTWSQWHSVHLAGLALKRRHPTLRWIAHFSDPWVNNPYMSHGWIARQLNRRLEREVLSAADTLVFTNQLTADRMLENYPATWLAKSRVVPHPFDSKLYPAATTGRDDSVVTLRYVGQFYGRRTPEPLFAALSALHRSDPDLLGALRIEFVGGVPSEHLVSDACRSLPKGLVTVRAPVDYVTSLRLMSEADGLLVIDAPGPQSVFLPSKLVDYLGAGRPILGITPRGTAADLLQELGYLAADPTDPQGIAARLRETIERLRRQPGRADWGATDVRARYGVGVVGAAMRELLFRG